MKVIMRFDVLINTQILENLWMESDFCKIYSTSLHSIVGEREFLPVPLLALSFDFRARRMAQGPDTCGALT